MYINYTKSLLRYQNSRKDAIEPENTQKTTKNTDNYKTKNNKTIK